MLQETKTDPQLSKQVLSEIIRQSLDRAYGELRTEGCSAAEAGEVRVEAVRLSLRFSLLVVIITPWMTPCVGDRMLIDT
jgi:hypothetical protein